MQCTRSNSYKVYEGEFVFGSELTDNRWFDDLTHIVPQYELERLFYMRTPYRCSAFNDTEKSGIETSSRDSKSILQDRRLFYFEGVTNNHRKELD